MSFIKLDTRRLWFHFVRKLNDEKKGRMSYLCIQYFVRVGFQCLCSVYKMCASLLQAHNLDCHDCKLSLVDLSVPKYSNTDFFFSECFKLKRILHLLLLHEKKLKMSNNINVVRQYCSLWKLKV